MTAEERRFPTYTHSEGRTGMGQLVAFTCAPEDKEKVVAFLNTIRTIEVPTTKRVNLSHGCYGRYTRYDVTQHKYAGGGPGEGGGWGYIEVLTITDPPDNKHGIVIHEAGSHLNGGSVFTEWETLEQALAVFEEYWGGNGTKEKFQAMPGFLRYVVCGPLSPWFYAVGDEQLQGDYSLPFGIEDDPVFRLGRQFVVEDSNGLPDVKTCMGSRYFVQDARYSDWGSSQPNKIRYRIVYWSDGTCWRDDLDKWSKVPRPLEEGELWIVEAIAQFRMLLGGKQTKFVINFTNDTKFVGKVVRTNHKSPCAEGDYYVIAHVKDGKPIEGWVNDFEPTIEDPDIVQFVIKRLERKGDTVERVEIADSKVKPGGKKWAGVFFSPYS